MQQKLKDELKKIFDTGAFGELFEQYNCDGKTLYHLRSKKGGYEGVLDEDGNWIVEVGYNNIWITKKSIFSTIAGSYDYEMLNLDGEKIVRNKFTNIFYNGYPNPKTLLVRHKNKKLSLIDIEGNFILKEEFSSVNHNFLNDKRSIRGITKNRKDGLIDFDGNYILEPEYSYIEELSSTDTTMDLLVKKDGLEQNITIEYKTPEEVNQRFSYDVSFVDFVIDMDFIRENLLKFIKEDDTLVEEHKEYMIDRLDEWDNLSRIKSVLGITKNLEKRFLEFLKENGIPTD